MGGCVDRIGQNPLAATHSWLDLLDRTFYLYRANFLSFVVPVALITVPLLIVNLVTSYALEDDLAEYWAFADPANSGSMSSAQMETTLFAAFGSLMGVMAVFILIAIIAGIIQGVLVNGVITYMTSEHHLGRKVGTLQALNAIKPRMLPLALGLSAWWAVILLLSFALGLILFACGLGLGLLAYVGFVLYSFLTPVLVLERVRVGEGLRRAWDLGKTRVWAVFWFIITIVTVNLIISLALSAITDLFIQPTVGSLSFSVRDVIDIITSAAIGIFLGPVLPVGLTLLYYDTRVRFEGLDIALSSVEKPDPRPNDLYSPPPMSKAMTRQDWTNLGLMTAASFVVFLVFGLIGQVLS